MSENLTEESEASGDEGNAVGIENLPDGVTIGAQTEFTLGIKQDTTVGLTNENFLGARIELSGALFFACNLSYGIEMNYGTVYVYHEGETINKFEKDNTNTFEEKVNNVYVNALTNTVRGVYSGNYEGGFEGIYKMQSSSTYHQGKIVDITGNYNESISGQHTYSADSVSSTIAGAIDQSVAGYSITISDNKSFNVTSGAAVLQVSPTASFLQIGSQGIWMNDQKTLVAGKADLGMPTTSSATSNVVPAETATKTVVGTTANEAIMAAESKNKLFHSKFVQKLTGRKWF